MTSQELEVLRGILAELKHIRQELKSINDSIISLA